MDEVQYSAAEVSVHSTDSDCWVIIRGSVYNVTKFLHQHPGGAAALSRKGRGGLDVTSHFERIGHSAHARSLLESMRVGILAETDCCVLSDERDVIQDVDTVDESAPLFGATVRDSDGNVESNVDIESEDREHSIMWHAKRRQDISREHPEVLDLVGSNPWTCVIGVVTVLVHCYTCMWVQRPDMPWYMSFLLAYTVGAVCKMYQFAVNHDVCHGTAGSWLDRSDLLRRCAMQLFTLPSIGGTMHTYYDIQHLGHHASLGAFSLADLSKYHDVASLNYSQLRKMLFFPDNDGDLFAIGTLSLGRILKSWGSRTYSDSISHRKYIGDTNIERPFLDFHRSIFIKILLFQLGHLQHHATMTILFLLLAAPLIPVFSAPIFIWPELFSSLLSSSTILLNSNRIFPNLDSESEKHVINWGVKMFSSISLHVWLWVLLDYWLLFHRSGDPWTWSSAAKGFSYLYLSDLFLYGFLMHPFMGYFLGVHRSGGRGFESGRRRSSESVVVSSSGSDSSDKLESGAGRGVEDALQDCQPTMSTYSFWSSLFSMNLSHHVEHHDFPGVPWNRLPLITKLAPEYYDYLEQSPGFSSTVYRWTRHSEGWSYACQ